MLSGRHDPGFEPLARTFAEVLARKPFGGAALTLYLDGRPVFDMWGGPRDNDGSPWEEHTSSISFSTAKGVAATALHLCRERGLVEYDAPVARYWPEFAQNGKERITLRHVLSHGAGLFNAYQLFEHADELLDWNRTIDVLARAAPAHEPGRYHAYHALTFGHLVGEIVQRVTMRPFAQFIQEELAAPLGLSQFFVGAPESALPFAARIYRKPQAAPRVHEEGRRAHREQRTLRMHRIARVLRAVGVPIKPERMHDAFFVRGFKHWDFASPRVLSACIPSLNGLFAARDLARMYAALANGGSLDGVHLLSAATLREATAVQTRKLDGVLVAPVSWRLGYHGVPSKFGLVRGAFGHAGYNGSGAWASPRHNAALGYVVNAGNGTPIGDMRMLRLTSTALACIRAVRRRG